MTDGETGNEGNVTGKETPANTEGNPQPLSPIEEAKEVLAKTEKAKLELKAENDRAEKIKSENILAGDSGGNVPTPKPKDPTPKEYAKEVEDKMKSGEYND